MDNTNSPTRLPHLIKHRHGTPGPLEVCLCTSHTNLTLCPAQLLHRPDTRCGVDTEDCGPGREGSRRVVFVARRPDDTVPANLDDRQRNGKDREPVHRHACVDKGVEHTQGLLIPGDGECWQQEPQVATARNPSPNQQLTDLLPVFRKQRQ